MEPLFVPRVSEVDWQNDLDHNVEEGANHPEYHPNVDELRVVDRKRSHHEANNDEKFEESKTVSYCRTKITRWVDINNEESNMESAKHIR